MVEPIWLTVEDIDELARMVSDAFPGHFVECYPHKRNDLEAATYRARNRYDYDEQRDLTALAAEYAYGIGKAHAFADGNKRICFLAARVFLELNQLRLTEPEAGFFAQPIKDLMANEIDTAQLAALFAANVVWIDDDEH